MDLETKGLPALVRRHRRWLGLCLATAAILEIVLWVYPPRGMVCSDVILLGSVGKTPLVDFPRTWSRFFHDDRFMFGVVEESGQFADVAREKWLRTIQGSIRPNLYYGMEYDTFVKISFKQPTAARIRGFLTCFTRRLLERLSLLGAEELEYQKARVLARIRQGLRRKAVLEAALGAAFPGIQGGVSGEMTSLAFSPPASQPFSFFAAGEGLEPSGTWKNLAGGFLTNEFENSLFNSLLEWKTLVATESPMTGIFPHGPTLLSDPEAPAVPVQPFLVWIYLLVPLGFFLIGCSGILIHTWMKRTADAPAAS